MWQADQCCRETKEAEVEDRESLPAALLRAGTGLLMAACLRRAVVVVFLVEQWRVWVFLVLNLVLLAIFFTSQKKVKKRECGSLEKEEKVEMKEEEDGEEIEKEEEEVGLTKEELNERVEAFIVMFKQHLISDAKKGANGL